VPEARINHTIVELPWKTLFRVIGAVVLVWLAIQLYQIVLLIVVAVLLAVTLNPVVRRLERAGLSRSAAVALVSVTLLVALGGFLWLTWSSLTDQARYASQHFESVVQQLQKKMPDWMRDSLSSMTEGDMTSAAASYALRFAESVTSAIVVLVMGFVLTVYLLIEGRRTRDWLVAFVPGDLRPRMTATLDACENAIFGYMAGNVATSICAATFALVTLSVLKVPAALLLAVTAGVFDFVPVLGLIASSVPAIILAATVSGKTALVVAILYAIYHTTENYVIAPYVYGDRLKLSNVAVIIAFAIGAELAGVIGALIALPIAAVYPAIERMWLRDSLPDETVREHRAIERKAV
jgi:predicted PurR-regulated permease PerM